MERRGAGWATHGGHENGTGLLSISCRGRGGGSFREDPRLPVHRAKPPLPKDGPVQRGQDCQQPVSLPGTGHRKLDSRENLALCRKTP